jgi:putative ABC transport system permease protein
VDANFFGTMNLEMVRGRGFIDADNAGSRRVAIVNEELASKYWPGREAIGRRMRLRDTQGPWIEVIGVAKTTKYAFISEPSTPFLYLPFEQNQERQMTLLVETASADASPVAGPLRDLLRTIDVGQPISSLRPYATRYRQTTIAPRLMLMQATGAMGTLGLALALIGLYGVVAYSVARRTKEIGVRMALGAARSDVLKMVLRQGLTLSMTGVLAGAAISAAVARVITAALTGVGAPTPAIYAVVPVAIVALTAAASYIPAYRASRVDPLRALRYE